MLPFLDSTAIYTVEAQVVGIQKLPNGEFQNAGVYFGVDDDLIVRIGFVDVDSRARVEAIVEYDSNTTVR